jgi:hypothetical protein
LDSVWRDHVRRSATLALIAASAYTSRSIKTGLNPANLPDFLGKVALPAGRMRHSATNEERRHDT